MGQGGNLQHIFFIFLEEIFKKKVCDWEDQDTSSRVRAVGGIKINFISEQIFFFHVIVLGNCVHTFWKGQRVHAGRCSCSVRVWGEIVEQIHQSNLFLISMFTKNFLCFHK